MVNQHYQYSADIYICESRNCYFTLIGQNNIISWGLNNWCSECHRYTNNNIRLTLNDENGIFYAWICPHCFIQL
jgi:hypothetical protein